MIYSESSINWIWYLYADHTGDGVIKIYDHFRLHRDRDKDHPVSHGSFRLLEEGNRVVTEAIIGGVIHRVENPKNVFEYGSYTPEEIIALKPCWLNGQVRDAFGSMKSRSVYHIATDGNIDPWDRVWCLIHMLPLCILNSFMQEYTPGIVYDHRDLLLDNLAMATMDLSEDGDTMIERCHQIDLLMPHVRS